MADTVPPLHNPTSSNMRSSDAESLHKDSVEFEEDTAVLVDPALVHSAKWKIDLVVVPSVAVFYLLAFLDRSNIGNAKVAGLTEDLRMTPHDFSVALTITYVPYILMELPMNLLMKKLGPNITLPAMVALWGVAAACQGTVNSYGALLACRFFLGTLEGGILPGITLYMSSFYQRHDMQFRFAIVFSATSLAGAFSGLLAAAIQNMDGDRHLAGWAWIFILEGVFTTVFGIISYFILPIAPSNVKFLTQSEREAYVQALVQDWSGDADADGKDVEVFSWSEVTSVLTDAPHVLLIWLPLFFNGLTVFGLANFTPTIVAAFGFSPTRTQLLTVPPYACSFIISLLVARFSDRYKQRGAFAVCGFLITGAGFAIFLATGNKHADYGALFLQIIGAFTTAPCNATLLTNNVQPHYRRASAIAVTFLATSVGGIVSTWIFLDPPRFRVASSLNLAGSITGAVVIGVVVFYLQYANRKKGEEIVRLEREDPGGAWTVRSEERRLGDRHPHFKFTL